MIKVNIVILTLTLLHSLPASWSYGTGAPAGVCKTMKPGHGVEGQTGPAPYEITLDKTTVLGADSLNITLSSPSGRPLKGFLVQVRKPGNDAAFGKFMPISSDSQLLACSKNEDSGITHTNSRPKSSVAVQWVAPNDADSDYEVVATFVEAGDVFWVKHVHPSKIRVTRNSKVEAYTPPPAKALQGDLLERFKLHYEGCGVSKGCFAVPAGCIENFLSAPESATEESVCGMMVTWEKKGGTNAYQLNGKLTNGYVAVGMAHAKEMGPASVVGCVVESGSASAYRSMNEKTHNLGHSNNKLGLVQQFGKIQDGFGFCEFTQTKHTIENIGDYDIDNDSYYYLLARGSSGSSSSLNIHSDKIAAPRAVHITDNEILTATNDKVLVQLHGAFMIMAWLICASTGMFTARYLKQTHTEVTPFNKAFWFVIHVTCMFSTFVLTVCGIIFIFVKKGGYSEGLTGSAQWHPILGLILTGLAVLQVLIAFFRPHPNTPKRPLFNWIHWSIGNSAHIVGIVCIFLADTLSLSGLKDHSSKWMWVVLGFVIFHILIHLVMSIHTVWADKQMNSKVKMRAARPGPMKPSGSSEEAPGTGLRTFLLVLYILGVVGFSAALVYFIVKGPEDDITS